MRFQTTLLSSLIAAALSACGGGNSGDAPGDTSNRSGQINTSYQVSCLDSNLNWQCDEGDSAIVYSADSSTLKPDTRQFVLFEERDVQNKRLSLLISEAGKNTANGQSTLKTLLGNGWNENLAKLANGELEAAFAKAIANYPLALAALQNQALAIKAQGIAQPVVTLPKTSISSTADVASWQGGVDETRQLVSRGSVVLSNTDSNRVYLFDAALAGSSKEIDLIPALDASLSAAETWIRGALEKTIATLLMVDTVSAASTVTGPPSTEKPLPLPAGKGLAGVALLKDGKEALLLIKNGKAKSSNSRVCDTSGSEGVFQVSLDPALSSASYRNLALSPRCLHKGFSLIAANDGQTVAWDDQSNTLWQLDPKTLQSIRQLPLKLSGAQAIALAGRFAAIAAYGQVSIVDLQKGQVLSHLSGDWSNVAALSFAAGQRRLLIASGKTVTTLALDKAMQSSTRSSQLFTDELRDLAVSMDGDSYAVASDKTLYWRSVEGNLSLGSSDLATGLSVKRITLAAGNALLLSQGAQDLKYRLQRLSFNGMAIK
ncbi:hypothetical protein [Iodobacter sp.]|uniref:hypothetical protein n=1 Tax=Iodobacter sp. TaxID=1915058 RepID=UPI0025CE3CC5|nr:hypothetical protein [Iodobacter sp.]